MRGRIVFEDAPEMCLPTSHYCVLGPDRVVPKADPEGTPRRVLEEFDDGY